MRLEVLIHEVEIVLKDAKEERACVTICFGNLLEHDLLHLVELHGLEVHLKEHVLGKDADVLAEHSNFINMTVVDDEQRDTDKVRVLCGRKHRLHYAQLLEAAFLALNIEQGFHVVDDNVAVQLKQG